MNNLPMSYPVLEVIPELKVALHTHPVIILQAPPGAGKSTVLPLHMVDEPWLAGRKILILEPRRLAARAVAFRMAALRGEEIGGTVGYAVRFESKVSASTRIQVVTEGVLNRMIHTDNALEDTGLIIFDEFHERSLHSDLALALGLQVRQILRPDLKILIMSATLDGDAISRRLNNAPVISSSGKQFPVTVNYSDNKDQSKTNVSVQAAAAIQKAVRGQAGDVLVFLPGAGEIRRTMQILEEDDPGVVVLPLYGDLSFADQQKAILPDDKGLRKVVLATSIAETSLTIEGISIVIDCGYSRVPKFDPRSGLTKLETVRVTGDSADQRAGRAGRLGPGICYRLWSKQEHQFLIPNRRPEILDADLSTLVLELALWGVRNSEELTWITLPPAGALSQAKELLHQLDALRNGVITERGKAMARLPTHPRIAHMLIEASADPELLELAIDCAALLEERDPLPLRYGVDLSLRIEELRKFRRKEPVVGDRHILERVERIARNWRKLLRASAASPTVNHNQVGTLLMAAYPDRIAQRTEKHGERYKLAGGRVARLLPDDPMVRERWIVAADVDAREGEGRIFMAAPLDPDDLLPLATQEEIVKWDEQHGRITGAIENRVGALILEQRPLQKISLESRRQVLCRLIREKGLKVTGWSETEENLQARILSLRIWNKDEEWPDVTDVRLLETVEDWLGPYLEQAGSRADLLKLDLTAALTALLSREAQRLLQELAPSKIRVPSGSELRLRYSVEGQMPVLEVRLQEVFGWRDTPRINSGKTPVLLHLLSPGYRAVQVTGDLQSFWSTGYAEVRKELRRRYPKHAWPEDPLTAKAVRGVRR